MSSILAQAQPLKIGDIIANLPIIQGGMGVGISLSGLASAVASEGGIGVIATPAIGMNEPDFFKNFLEANVRALRKEIRKARELSQGILGVNIMVALTNFADLVRTSIEEGIDVIFSGAGLPLNLPEFLQNTAKTKLVPIVSSGRAIDIIIRRWSERYKYLPDAVVVEGPLAGGHLGFKEQMISNSEYSLEKLVPEVILAIKPYEKKYGRPIPVIAAGGIYTGEDIYRFFQLGASGVQMATRFVTTHECDANIRFKEAYINAKENDITIIKSPVGMPGRAIRNKFLDDVSAGKKKPFRCFFHCLKTCELEKSPYCISYALISAKKGNLNHGFAFCGSNAWKAEKIISVKETFETLKEEYRNASSGEDL
ncbi:MAG: nitronate monooxygenase family protein [Candidatus Moranbacteria bacterium]|nr:nitronate monooxygenase family protein [Candidatus Moranbacteria bacterium]